VSIGKGQTLMANKHYHKYRLKDLARKRDVPPYHVYICIKQDCSHHIRVELIDGKISECNRCGEPFLMKLAKLKHGDRIIVKLMESILPKAING
jgi:DNA-directed RNA polymerase subunit RPC12/RpoP